MSAVPKVDRPASVAEYLAAEEKAVEKHEYRDGWIVEMQGGTYAHSRINANFVASVHLALRGSPCFVLESNMRVHIRRANKYCYPDASIVCGKPEFDLNDPKQTTIINPRVIVEVVSESSEAYDRGAKFLDYMLIPSLEEYVLVAQDMVVIQSVLRQNDATWSMTNAIGLDAVARIRCVGVDVPLKLVYDGIEFPPPRKQVDHEGNIQ
jgi:Uma2 family endonuclease